MNTKLKTIEKIAKLLALAEGTCHEAEALSAKRRAAQLMAKHQIESIELGASDDFERDQMYFSRSRIIKWEVMTIHLVARYNGVFCVYFNASTGRKSGMKFLGRSSDLECFHYMLDVVVQQRDHAFTEYRDKWEPGMPSRNLDAWMTGFNTGLSHKLDELRKMENTIVEEKGLVPVSAYEQAKAAWDGGIGKNRWRQAQSSMAGYTAGRNTSIHRGISRKATNLQLN